MNTSNNITTLNNNENTNIYLNSVHEINYLQRLKKINSRENIYLNSNPNTANNNHYNTNNKNHTTKNDVLQNRMKELSGKIK